MGWREEMIATRPFYLEGEKEIKITFDLHIDPDGERKNVPREKLEQ
jgi:hypothetical protein